MLDLNFTAKQVDTDIQSLNKHLGLDKDIDISCGGSDSTVDYELQPEAREWGIKYIAIIVGKVHCIITWSCDTEGISLEDKAKLIAAGGMETKWHKTNDDFGGVIEGTIDVDTTKKINGKEWKVDSELEFGKDGLLNVDNVTIDFEDYVITVS